MSDKDDKKNENTPESGYNLDTTGLELLPPGARPESEEILPGQFNEHLKTLKRLEENWKKIDRRKRIRRQCPDRRQEIRFGARDRRLAKFDRRRVSRGWKGEWF